MGVYTIIPLLSNGAMTVSEIDSRQKIYPLEYEKFSPRHSRRWFIVLFAGLIMFGNHYARDALGALEIQIETDSVVSVDQYATINSIYFFPSIVAPLFAGIFSEYLGGAKKCLLYSVISSSVGHIIFSLGMQLDDIRLIYTGRSLAGMIEKKHNQFSLKSLRSSLIP